MNRGIASIVATLRQVWNARGAADIQAIDSQRGHIGHGHIKDAIKDLDR